jgi:biotin carboxyl carrier protein
VRFDAPPGSATESQGLAVRYAAAKRRVSSWRWYLLFAVVVALPLYFGVQLLLALVWVSAPGQVELQESFVKAGAAGHVTMLAAEGQRVAAGEAIARVAPVAPLPAATAALAATPGPAAPDPESLAAAEAAAVARESAARGTLELAEAQLREREHWRRTIAELVAQGAATAAEQRSAQARWEDAGAELVRARAELEGARQAASRLQAALGRPAASTAEAAGATGRPGAAGSTAAGASAGAAAATWPVPAPIAGRVVRMSARSGDWVAPDTEVAVIQAPTPPLVRGWVQPADARHAVEGAAAVLHFYDGTSVPARVLRVEREATRMPPERLGPLAARGQALVIVLEPLAPLPERYGVHDLPVEVRFRRW